MTSELPIVQKEKRCRGLLSKGLYVNAGLPPGEEAVGDSGPFWCSATQTIFGPDKQLCDDEHCRDPTRACYKASWTRSALET